MAETPFANAKAQDALCRSVYGETWSMEQASALLDAVSVYLATLSGAQEAVAWRYQFRPGDRWTISETRPSDKALPPATGKIEPLYASPPVPVAHICGCPATGTYEGQVTLVAPDWLKHKWPNGIGIDACLALEISKLWKAGIQTTGHCCGHGRSDGFISVWPEFAGHMKALGYETYPHPDGRDDHFRPKTRFAPVPVAAKGYRILAPDELDPVTLEAAAKVAANHTMIRDANVAHFVATAIRSLIGGGDAE